MVGQPLTSVFAWHLREAIGGADDRFANNKFYLLYEKARVRITTDLKWFSYDEISKDIMSRSSWWNL